MADLDHERLLRRLLILDSYGFSTDGFSGHVEDEGFMEDDWLKAWWGQPVEGYVQDELDALDLTLSEERSRTTADRKVALDGVVGTQRTAGSERVVVTFTDAGWEACKRMLVG